MKHEKILKALKIMNRISNSSGWKLIDIEERNSITCICIKVRGYMDLKLDKIQSVMLHSNKVVIDYKDENNRLYIIEINY